LQQKNPSSSLSQLAAAIQIYENTAYYQQLALLYADRARAYLALGQPLAAESDFRRAIQMVQKQRKAVVDEILRAAYLEEFKNIFEDMVMLQIRLGRKDLALDYAESSRSQVLRELMMASDGSMEGPILKSPEIQKHLSKDSAIIEYLVLPQALLVWIIRQDALYVVETEISSESLSKLVGHFNGLVVRDSISPWRDESARLLSDLVIGKILPLIRGMRRLVVIPDRALEEIPFAAILDRATEKYLVQSYEINLCYSANIYVHALELERAMTVKSAPDVMVMGDPAFDSSILHDLPRLPYAESEAKSVARLYSSSHLVLGEQATRKVFSEGLSRFDVMHFAGHAINNPTAPLASFLALAPRGNDSGVLYARDLYMTIKPRAHLVILSTCSSLAGRRYTGEGVVSLARPFLASGVPAVVASLGNVDDKLAARFFVSFHRYLLSGLDAVAALRQAQLDEINRASSANGPLASWADFELIGSGSVSLLQGDRR